MHLFHLIPLIMGAALWARAAARVAAPGPRGLGRSGLDEDSASRTKKAAIDSDSDSWRAYFFGFTGMTDRIHVRWQVLVIAILNACLVSSTRPHGKRPSQEEARKPD